MILKTPISAVVRTCVPPHSSRDQLPSPTSTMRTTSPYFSPNSAIAPRLGLVERGRERAYGLVVEDHPVDAVLDPAPVLVAQRRAVGEVEAQLVRADVGARLAHVGAEALAQRRVQQVRRGVVALGRAARGGRPARTPARRRATRRSAARARAPGRRRRARRRPPWRCSRRPRTRSRRRRGPGRRRWRRTATRRAWPAPARSPR